MSRRLRSLSMSLVLACGLVAAATAPGSGSPVRHGGAGTDRLVTTSAPTAAASESSRGRYPTRWKCNDNDVCVRLTGRAPSRFARSWSGVVENRTDRWIRDAKCQSRTSRTRSYEVTASIGGELKVGLFATMNATISGTVARQMTSEIEFSVPFDVPPKTDTSCTQGIRIFRWKAQRFDRVRQSVTNFRASAPRRVAWVIKDIR